MAVDLAWVHEELGELARAHRRGRKDEFVEELTDISIFILGIFAMLKVNGWEMLLKKMKMNQGTEYQKRGGFYIREDEKRERKTLDKVEVTEEELADEPSIKEIQQRIIENKQNKGFKSGDMQHEMVCMVEEAGEAAWARRMGLEDKFVDALTDLLIFTLGVFEMKEVDGYKEILNKMKINEAREYRKKDKDMGMALTRIGKEWR